MKAAFEVDAISFTVETTVDDDISFFLPDHMGDDIRLSIASTNLLIIALMTAVADLEEED